MSKQPHADYKKAANNSKSTAMTSRDNESVKEKIGEKILGSHRDNIAERAKFLKGGKHPLLTAAVVGYAIRTTDAQHKIKSCSKKAEKLKKLRKHLDDAAAIAGQPWDNTAYFFNVAGAAFERKMIEIKEERLKKKQDKCRRRVERSQKLGSAIASGAYMLNEVSRTLSMKRVIDSPSGSTAGIDRDKLAVGIMHDDDISMRAYNAIQQQGSNDGPSV